VWNLEPRLEGEIVILEPLAPAHFDALLEASRPPEIWNWWTVDMSTEAAFRTWFDNALRAREDCAPTSPRSTRVRGARSARPAS